MSALFERNVHCLLGIPFDAIDMAGAMRQVRDAASRGEPCFMSTPNVNWLVSSMRDEALRLSVVRSRLSLVDGMPLVWVARMLGIPIYDRVAGSTLFETLRRDPGAGLSVYFFGGQPGVAEAACKKLNAEGGGLKCVGFECPGFGSIEDMSADECIARINASGADFIVVALGAKKGQAWIEHNRHHLSAPVISHLGAVVDFVAGRVSRAPRWTQQTGLEWLWRIKEDPSLWKRYYHDGTDFLRLLVTRVAPLAWFIRRHRPTRDSIEAASIAVERCEEDVVVHLRGAWVQDNLTQLRNAFSTALTDGDDVTVHMGDVCYVDSAFIGLAMLLQEQMEERGRRLVLESPTRPVRQIFRYHCADYLLRH